MSLRDDIAKVIGIDIHNFNSQVEFKIIESFQEDGYVRHKIEYNSFGDMVPAFLLLPEVLDNNPAVLINHQHNGERHLGKSEVCGLAGNPLQAFGPKLARHGFVVLAPDTICFEERRKNAKGIEPLDDDMDFLQHMYEMSYRIINGEYLMKKVLEDTMNGISLLCQLEYVDKNRIGTLGHSMGGNTVQFLAAMDERISFSCASGSACTYENRMKNGVGIEFASVIPNFHTKYDIDDLLSCVAPRKLLLVSADEDKYSKDAPYIVEKISKTYAKYDAISNLSHIRFQGAHALTQERFDAITSWMIENGTKFVA